MIILIALLLGLVQGLCEFLPVSSSGHLFLVSKLTQGAVGEGTFGTFFTVMLHVATLVAFALILKKFDALDKWLDEGNFLGFSFLLTAIFLTVSEILSRRRKPKKSIDTMRWTDALVIGGMQAIGVLPGVSRSGSTIAGALGMRIDRKSAADFSFLMSIPAILGGLVLELYKLTKDPNALESVMTLPYWGVMLVAMLAAAISGYFAVRFMIRLVTKKGLFGFAIYTGVLGLIVILLQIFRVAGFGFTPFGG